jgi:3-phenylpropionate/trans-cinnamate dioxygenase ferredoxin reductase subunit
MPRWGLEREEIVRTPAKKIVIVGAGLAGASAAMALRERGFDGRLTLVGQESHLPYNRPPLSKGLLTGKEDVAEILVHSREEFGAQAVELRLGTRVRKIDTASKQIELEEGERLGYYSLLIATGSRNRQLATAGAELDAIFQLRTIEDAEGIRARASAGSRAVVVGMGFIGSEVAASLRARGVTVTAIEGAPAPLGRVLGDQIGGVLAEVHREQGVELILGDTPVAFEGKGKVERVRTKLGRVIECDFVVAGIGVQPESELAQQSGIAVDNGVLVDPLCRTNLPGVYAAGDVTNHFHPFFGRRMRVEHWNNAVAQGQAAAASMLGDGEPYAELHSFWSDQYEHSLEYVGSHLSAEHVVVRGSLEARRFLAFFQERGVVTGVLAMNESEQLPGVTGLIRAQATVSPGALGDESLISCSSPGCRYELAEGATG